MSRTHRGVKGGSVLARPPLAGWALWGNPSRARSHQTRAFFDFPLAPTVCNGQLSAPNAVFHVPVSGEHAGLFTWTRTEPLMSQVSPNGRLPVFTTTKMRHWPASRCTLAFLGGCLRRDSRSEKHGGRGHRNVHPWGPGWLGGALPLPPLHVTQGFPAAASSPGRALTTGTASPPAACHPGSPVTSRR